MKAVKSVQAMYEASAELATLFEDFRLMCNDALRIALAEKPKSRSRLIELSYRCLKEHHDGRTGSCGSATRRKP